MLISHRGERVNESGPWIFSFDSIFYVKLLLVKHLTNLWKQLYCSHVFPPTVHCCSVSVNNHQPINVTFFNYQTSTSRSSGLQHMCHELK